MTAITLPEWIEIGTTKSFLVERFAVGSKYHRPGESVMLSDGQQLVAYGKKGKLSLKVENGAVVPAQAASTGAGVKGMVR